MCIVESLNAYFYATRNLSVAEFAHNHHANNKDSLSFHIPIIFAIESTYLWVAVMVVGYIIA